jgi:WD40 repeat protein
MAIILTVLLNYVYGTNFQTVGTVRQLSMLALGIEGGVICVVDELTGITKFTVNTHNPDFLHAGVSVSPNGEFLATTAMSSKQWKIFDCHGDLRQVQPVHNAPIGCTCGGVFVGMCVCPEEPDSGLLAVEFSPCDRWIATSGVGGIVCLLDIQNNEAGLVQTNAETELTSLSFSGDGNCLMCAGCDELIYIIDVQTRNVLKSWKGGHAGSFCPTNNNLLATMTKFVLSLWDVSTETRVWSLPCGHSDEELLNFALFSPDGMSIVVAGQTVNYETDSSNDDNTENPTEPQHINVVDAVTGTTKFRLMHDLYNSIHGAAFSVDGSKLASVDGAGHTGTCKVWDLCNGELLWSIGLLHPVLSVAWGRDWVRDQACVAFAMGMHERLGGGSQVSRLDAEMVRIVLESM